MRFFIWEGDPPRSRYSHDLPGSVLLNITPAYTELFEPCSGRLADLGIADQGEFRNSYFVFYWVQLAEHQWAVMNSFEHYLDPFVQLLADPTTRTGAWKAMTEACPNLAMLMERSSTPLNHDFSLANIQDTDTNEWKWFTAGFFGNWDGETIADLFFEPSVRALIGVLPVSLRLLGETWQGPQGMPRLHQYLEEQRQVERVERVFRAIPKIAERVLQVANILDR